MFTSSAGITMWRVSGLLECMHMTGRKSVIVELENIEKHYAFSIYLGLLTNAKCLTWCISQP